LVDEPAIQDLGAVADVSAASLWAAFRDRYTRAKGRHGSVRAGAEVAVGEPPGRAEPTRIAGA